MNLIMLSNYMNTLNSTRKLPTKNVHFAMHILFSTIYLWQEQKLNPNKNSEQEINMGNFVQATEYDMCKHAKFEYLNIHIFL
jgi:hypothetical protein